MSKYLASLDITLKGIVDVFIDASSEKEAEIMIKKHPEDYINWKDAIDVMEEEIEVIDTQPFI